MPTEVQNTNKLTIGKIVRDMEPSQFWAVLVALGALLSGAFYVGQRFPFTSTTAAPTAEMDIIPCYLAKDWPEGYWWAWGPAKNMTHNVYFSKTGYESVTGHNIRDANQNIYKARIGINEEFKRGRRIHLDGQDNTGYKAQETLTVSSDGCRLDGTFTDTDGNEAEEHLYYTRGLIQFN
jgi:hypothetical protein